MVIEDHVPAHCRRSLIPLLVDEVVIATSLHLATALERSKIKITRD